jgi:hypothetical protein
MNVGSGRCRRTLGISDSLIINNLFRMVRVPLPLPLPLSPLPTPHSPLPTPPPLSSPPDRADRQRWQNHEGKSQASGSASKKDVNMYQLMRLFSKILALPAVQRAGKCSSAPLPPCELCVASSCSAAVLIRACCLIHIVRCVRMPYVARCRPFL